MRKVLFILMLPIVTGCSSSATAENVEVATKACKGQGGFKSVSGVWGSNISTKVACKSGATVQIQDNKSYLKREVAYE